MPLDRYRRMRDFASTPEPAGSEEPPAGNAPRFVVQEHHARALHWDFRLEHDGVLVSWAVPKGIPQDPKTNHLAVQTEDHPLEYIDFEGEIPEKQYGAGRVSLWDRGTYELEKWRDREVMVVLHGERLSGRYVLFRTDERNWMIHRMDPPADPSREPMPVRIEPMLAKLVEKVPAGHGWAFEIKWDGIRAIAYVDGGRLRLLTRNQNDVTARYPELRPMAESLGALQVVLDGEIVAFDASGRPSFERLQGRMGLGGEKIGRRLADIPAHYVAFDLLFLDGHSLLGLPYRERRRLLEGLGLNGPNWQSPKHFEGDGNVIREATRAQGLEGVMAKRLDSPYEPGQRTGAWLKIKNNRHQLFVVGGWLQRENAAGPAVGALLLGYYDATGTLVFAGRAGSGLTEEVSTRLAREFRETSRPDSPFAPSKAVPPGANFCEPLLAVDVTFLEWTNEGLLRHPTFKGIRPDVDAKGIGREA